MRLWREREFESVDLAVKKMLDFVRISETASFKSLGLTYMYYVGVSFICILWVH